MTSPSNKDRNGGGFLPNPLEGNDRPTLNFINAVDGEQVTIAFGYLAGRPTAALFHDGDRCVLIPREVLSIAAEQGWGEL